MTKTEKNRAKNAVLVLDDGSVFPGHYFGAEPKPAAELTSESDNFESETGTGEVVFNTGMTGYYEILTDPSYTGQLVVMTYPHIGNYGIDHEWTETALEKGVRRAGIKAAGLIVRKLYRGEVPAGRHRLEEVLSQNNVTGIEKLDTRGLTLKIREGGSPRGVLLRCGPEGISDEELAAAVDALKRFPPMEGRNLLGRVGTVQQYRFKSGIPEEAALSSPARGLRIAVLDCGLKANIVRELGVRRAEIDVFPSQLDGPEEILEGGYDGVMLSNGPGDPASLKKQIDLVRKLIGKIPICGICLGHQLISLALGAVTFKMKFGHHGLNHPVLDRETGRVFVTSQNHGFSVDSESLPEEAEARFVNANDQTIEGISHKSMPILSVQFHPEACPGPLDSLPLFDEFLAVFGRK